MTGKFPNWADIGTRICITGPSNSGKSTLNHALATKLGVMPTHLDQLAHIPNTAWIRRDDKDFVADHDRIIAQDSWVIDGNYSVSMEKRLARASAVIWLDPSLLGCMWRYFRRCRQEQSARFGGLDGAQHEFSFDLIHYTLTRYPKNRAKYARFLKACSDIPVLKIASFKDLNALYAFWALPQSFKPA